MWFVLGNLWSYEKISDIAASAMWLPLATKDLVVHSASDVHGSASSHGPSRAKVTAWPWLWPGLRFWKAKAVSSDRGLSTEIFGTRRAYTRLTNSNFGIISHITAILESAPRRKSTESDVAPLLHSVLEIRIFGASASRWGTCLVWQCRNLV
jgi:hypothetical protein